jgi:hypothetical protein
MVELICWSVDSLTKVFRDDGPREAGEVLMESARNEFESGQIALRCSLDAKVSVSCSSLANADGQGIPCRPRFVGFVKVRENARDTPPEEIIRPAPGEFPDFLMDQNPVQIEANRTQPVWLTVFIPESAAPGTYEGSMTVRAKEAEETVSVGLQVHSATVPDRRNLYLTNWIKPDSIAKFAGVAPWSEKHWALLRAHARNMAEHRQNVVLTPIHLIQITRKDGNLSFDFSRFDRWIRTFREEGIDGLIEGGHLGGRAGEWESSFNLRPWEITESGETVSLPPVPVESQECEKLLSELLPALVEHLEEQGWVDRYVQHLADEPVPDNAESYRRLADLVGKYAPGLRRIDANMTTSLEDCLEIWVPILNGFDNNKDYYRDRMNSGSEVWFYTCLGPSGRYPNRFIDFSLLKVRILHWINFRYGLSGYLHWGYNYWTENPLEETQPDWSHGAPLPAGDMCIVYPGPEGPVESIRYEAMRDGVEDYELLRSLSIHDPEAAQGLCEKMVRSPTDYEREATAFREARGGLLRILDDIP